MTNDIKLSIIVPCYKVERYLPRCLDSLVNQTLEDIEIICVNDGSPDSCLDIINDYHNRYGDKIFVINKENEGLYLARIDGIKEAKGRYIGCIDSDDYVALDYAEKMYNAAINNDADVVVCGFDRVDLDTGNLYSREMTKFRHNVFDVQENPGLLIEVNSAAWNKIYRSDLLKNLYPLSNVPRVLEDIMFTDLVFVNSNKIAFVKEPLIYYMVRKDSIINTLKEEYIVDVYNALSEVREVYLKINPNMLDYLDASAFLHLGISLMYRLSSDKQVNFDKVFKDNINFLDETFPKWRSNPYLSLNFVLSNNGSNLKTYLVKKIYDLHMFKLFLNAYKFMINNVGIDIKW